MILKLFSDRPGGQASAPRQFALPDVRRRRMLLSSLAGLPLLGLGGRLWGAQTGGGIEQFWAFNIKPEVFLEDVFAGNIPQAQSVAVGGAVSDLIQPLPHRMRYWRAEGKTVWIFDELGKDGYQPTTCGFVVRDDAIEQAKVLIYRESRGEQVGQPSFLQQLVGARIAGGGLSAAVDNISGATYSVKMMQRMARAALLLDQMAS